MDTYYHSNHNTNTNNNNNTTGSHLNHFMYHTLHKPLSIISNNNNEKINDDNGIAKEEEYNTSFGPYPISQPSIGRLHSYPIGSLPYSSSSSLSSTSSLSFSVKQQPTEIPPHNNQSIRDNSYINITPIELSYSKSSGSSSSLPSSSVAAASASAAAIAAAIAARRVDQHQMNQSIRNPVIKNPVYSMEQSNQADMISYSNSNNTNSSVHSNNNNNINNISSSNSANLMKTIQNIKVLIDCNKKIWQKAKFGNDDVKRKIMEKGGAIVVLEGMKYHRENHEVQSSACGAFASLALNSENQIILAEIGAIEAVKCALKLHKMNEEVQQFGCSALMNLAANPANQSKLMRMGASNIVIDAMTNFKANEKIQQSGCGALGNLAGLEENREILINMRADEVIISAMNNHLMKENVQQHGCGSLMNLLINKEKEQMKISIEVVDTVISAMNTYQANSIIQMNGIELLWNFAFTINNNKIQLVEKGVIEIIINAMMNHKMNEKLLQRGCSVIRSILSFKGSILEAFKRGSDKKLNEVTQTFVDGQLEDPIAHIYPILKRLYEINEDIERYDDFRGIENIESAIHKIDAPGLQISLARLKESLTLKASITQRLHLGMLMDKYIASYGKQTHSTVDKPIGCNCSSLNLHLSELNKTIMKINETEALMGKEMIVNDGNDHQSQTLQDLNQQRDEQKKIFNNMYNKYKEMRGKVTCIINDDCENGKELIVIENEIKKIEKSLFEPTLINVTILENHQHHYSSQSSNSKRMKGEEIDENVIIEMPISSSSPLSSDLENLENVDALFEEILKSDEVGIEEELNIIKNSINRLANKSKMYHEKVLELQNLSNHHQ